MTATIDLTPILELPVAQRIEVVQEILDSIAADAPRPPLSEEFKQELRRRRDEARANPDDGIPWEQVKSELNRRVADDDANPEVAVSWTEVEATALARARRRSE